jgi:hypothetical protein
MTEKFPSAPQQFDERIPFHNEHGRNDRFSYAKVRRGDEWYFLKTAQQPELQENLQREFLWAEFMQHVAVRHPEAQLRAPHVLGFEPDGGLLMEYIDAPQVATSSDIEGWKAHMDRYAKTLAVLDECSDWDAPWPDSSQLSGVADIHKVWHRWLGEYYDDVSNLREAHQLVAEGLPTLHMCVQHADLTPWQMFANGDEWIIYDGEKAGDHLPRYNDLAYGYGRLFTRLQDPHAAGDLLRKFLIHSGVNQDQFWREFLPILTFRSVGMLADAYHDTDRDYVDGAQDLLRRCLGRDASDIF